MAHHCLGHIMLTIIIIQLVSTTIDHERTLVFGPAIELPDIDMPVRYLFIQLIDYNGQKYVISHHPYFNYP